MAKVHAPLVFMAKSMHEFTSLWTGMPIMCNQTIRLTSLSTGRNLHASWADAPLKTHEVSAYGENGHGNAGAGEHSKIL